MEWNRPDDESLRDEATLLALIVLGGSSNAEITLRVRRCRARLAGRLHGGLEQTTLSPGRVESVPTVSGVAFTLRPQSTATPHELAATLPSPSAPPGEPTRRDERRDESAREMPEATLRSPSTPPCAAPIPLARRAALVVALAVLYCSGAVISGGMLLVTTSPGAAARAGRVVDRAAKLTTDRGGRARAR